MQINADAPLVESAAKFLILLMTAILGKFSFYSGQHNPYFARSPSELLPGAWLARC
jgi:hypothetical protein